MDNVKRARKALRKHKVERILIVSGYNSFKSAHPFIDRILDAYNNSFHVEYILGVRANIHYPETSHKAQADTCDCIIAAGGGSVIDYAKLLLNIGMVKKQLFIVIPTIIGCGSEYTKYAVYFNGLDKISYENESIIPDIVLNEESIYFKAPIEQKIYAHYDAFAHAIESLLSKHAVIKSRIYALIAVHYLINYKNDVKGAMYAAKAINISKTTAGHALAYYLTAKHGIPHGEAVSMTLGALMRHEGFPEKVCMVTTRTLPEVDIDDWLAHVNLERLSNYKYKLILGDLVAVMKMVKGEK
jgi:alcohol dehydrogenase class IV